MRHQTYHRSEFALRYKKIFVIFLAVGILWCSLVSAHVEESSLMKNPTSGSTLTAYTVTFKWSGGIGASQYYLGVGTSQGSISSSPYGDIYLQSTGMNTSATVSGILLNGQPVYVRLWRYGTYSEWNFADYVWRYVD
jgi:hypothetical protein